MQRSKSGAVVVAVAIAFITAVALSPLWARKPDPSAPADNESRPKLPPGEMKLYDQAREALGCSDQEWEILWPRIAQVMAASKEVNAGRGAKGPPKKPWKENEPKEIKEQKEAKEPKPGEPVRQLSLVEQTVQDLRTVAVEPSATAAVARERITAFRQARLKAGEQLTRAQDELRGLLTPRQEAGLIALGVLD
jgi:hypothetical protein